MAEEPVKRQILLVEDDKSLSRAVSVKLEKEGYAVLCAESMKQAKELYRSKPVYFIICDINMPDGNGLDFCVAVRQAERQTENPRKTVFLFLTAMDTETDMINGYEAGGDDYVTKPFPLAVLVSKVNAMMNRYFGQSGCEGGSPETKKRLCSGNITLYPDENRAEKNGEYLNLTANEHRLLTYFMENPMRILSRGQLLEAIWDKDGTFVDENTLAVNIRRLREKVELDPSKPEIIKNVRGLGYIWERNCEKRPV